MPRRRRPARVSMLSSASSGSLAQPCQISGGPTGSWLPTRSMWSSEPGTREHLVSGSFGEIFAIPAADLRNCGRGSHRLTERMRCGSGYRDASGERRGVGPGRRVCPFCTPTTPSRSSSCVRTSAKRGPRWGADTPLPAQLLAEKRIGFLLLSLGLVLYLSGVVLKSPRAWR